MTKPPLTVHNAEITTARVEIKTLTVSGKQVTLAVFRQLLNAEILGDDGVLAGEPWGIVNYHPDKCALAAAHWHVVWQHGTDLFRSAVSVTPPGGEFWPDEADRFITSCIYDHVASGGTRFFNGEPPVDKLRGSRDGIVITKEAAFHVRMAPSPRGYDVISALGSLTDVQGRAPAYGTGKGVPSWYQTQLQQAEKALADKVAALAEEIAGYETTTEELFSAYQASIRAEAARRARHEDVRKTIADLPQLFIAV